MLWYEQTHKILKSDAYVYLYKSMLYVRMDGLVFQSMFIVSTIYHQINSLHTVCIQNDIKNKLFK